MERNIAVNLRALAWLVLVIGAVVWGLLILSALQTPRGVDINGAAITLVSMAFGALLAGGILWAVLMMLGFTLDAVLDIRNALEGEEAWEQE